MTPRRQFPVGAGQRPAPLAQAAPRPRNRTRRTMVVHRRQVLTVVATRNSARAVVGRPGRHPGQFHHGFRCPQASGRASANHGQGREQRGRNTPPHTDHDIHRCNRGSRSRRARKPARQRGARVARWQAYASAREGLDVPSQDGLRFSLRWQRESVGRSADRGTGVDGQLTQRAQESLFARAAAHFETLWADNEFPRYDPDNVEHRQALAAAVGRESFGSESTATVSFFDLQPKTYQQEMVEQLSSERAHGRQRNLVVAAMGTGKTIIAAFDYKNSCGIEGRRPRLLFVCHREEILRQPGAKSALGYPIGHPKGSFCPPVSVRQRT
jgi:hypothetical protein